VKNRELYRGIIYLFAFGITSSAAAVDETPATKSYTAEIWDYLTTGGSLTIGVGGREADLTVTRLSDNASGKLVQRNERSYFLNYSTRPIFFDDSKFGYDFVFNLSTFKMGQQQTANNVYQDLGTGGSGRFAYIVPTLFYMWGDHRQGTYFKAGIGLGAGIATFDGDIILTDSATQDQVTFSNKSTALRFASSLELEARWKNWGILLTAAGPNLQKDGYEFQLGDIAFSFGYRFTF
jgi:hypothetical protein